MLGPLLIAVVRTPSKIFDDIRSAGAAFFALVVVVPDLAARIGFYLRTANWYRSFSGMLVEKLRLRRQWNPTPSAWDFAFGQSRPGWVRVRLADGSWVGGWIGEASFASSFPEPQELFVEVGYVMTPDGKISNDISAPGGMVVRCQEALVVDFIPTGSDNETRPEEAQ